MYIKGAPYITQKYKHIITIYKTLCELKCELFLCVASAKSNFVISFHYFGLYFEFTHSIQKNGSFFYRTIVITRWKWIFFFKLEFMFFFLNTLECPNEYEATLEFTWGTLNPHRFYLKSYFFNRKYRDPPRFIFFPVCRNFQIFFFVYLAKTIILHAEKNGGLTSLSRQSIKRNHFAEDGSWN